MTKVERLLINKGHYLDDTYHLVMDIVKVVDNLKDNVAERLNDDLSDAYAMCEGRCLPLLSNAKQIW